ncbi:MAG: protoporphyrinogen oxidase [Myxococcales bacterium]|nr:protoporphyrinogen oxidase [Myxococcales bacterium]
MMATPRDNPELRHLDVAIVGGGISGLAAAFRLRAHQESAGPLSVRLFEAGDRLGGTIRTERIKTEEQGDCVCEAGPDSMVTTKPAAIDLCRELGLGDALVEPRSAKAFSVVHERRLHPLPAGFRLIAPTERWPLLRSGLFSWPGKLRMLRESRVKVSDELAADESVESFVVRRFGREAFERVAEPVLGGVFVADATELSAARTLGPFVELERQYGSVLRGLRDTSRASSSPAQLTLGGGLGSLVERLSEQIPSTWIELDCAAKQIRPLPRGGWQIDTARGMWLARDVLLACPAPRCSALLSASVPTLASALAGLRFASCVTVNLVYRRGEVTRLPNDFGFFVPRREPNHILAATYAGEKFAGRAPRDYIVVRTFQGGTLDRAAVDLDDETLVERSHRDLARLIGVTGPPRATSLTRFREAVPQFEVGHAERVARLNREVEKHEGLYLAGSALGAYGLADCVASGEAVAATICAGIA